jgi:hypothetical protein
LTVEVNCRSDPVIVTVAFGTKEPDASVTWPLKLAFWLCANALTPKSNRAEKNRKNELRGIPTPPKFNNYVRDRILSKQDVNDFG